MLSERAADAFARPLAPRAFPAHERRLLLSLPRIGPTVVERIEAQGVASLQDLRRLGVDRVVDEICRCIGTPAWANRRSALTSALHAAARFQAALAIGLPTDRSGGQTEGVSDRTAA